MTNEDRKFFGFLASVATVALVIIASQQVMANWFRLDTIADHRAAILALSRDVGAMGAVLEREGMIVRAKQGESK